MSQHLFVDSILGNDGTAILNNGSLPWKTITAARNYYVSNDLGATGSYTIWVRSGIYNEGNLYGVYSTSGVTDPILRYHFEEGCQITTSFQSIDTSDYLQKLEVTGWARFFNNSYLIDLSRATQIYFECFSINGGVRTKNVDVNLTAVELISSVIGISLTNGTSIINVDSVTGNDAGVLVAGTGTSVVNININKLNATGTGYRNIQENQCQDNLKIRHITADIGIELLGTDSGILTQSTYDIGNITANTGIFNSMRQNLTLTGSINKIIAGGTGYYIESQSCVDTLNIGLISAATGIEFVTENNKYTCQLRIGKIIAGIGIHILPTSVPNTDLKRIMEPIINEIQASNIGYLNEASQILEENYRINYMNAPLGFRFKNSSLNTVKSNFVINHLIGTTGISIENTGSLNLNFIINKLEADVGYHNQGIQDVTDIITINNLKSTNTGIVLNSKLTNSIFDINTLTGSTGANIGGTGTFTSNINAINATNGYYNSSISVFDKINIGVISNIAGIGVRLINSPDTHLKINRIRLNSGSALYIDGDQSSKLCLDIKFCETTTLNTGGGVFFGGNYKVIGYIGQIFTSGSCLGCNSTSDIILKFGSMICNYYYFLCYIYSGKVKIQGLSITSIVDTSGLTPATTIYSYDGINDVNIMSATGLIKGLEVSSGQMNFNCDLMTSYDPPYSQGIQVYLGKLIAKVGNLLGFTIGFDIYNSNQNHQITADLVDTPSYAVLLSGSAPKINLSGIFISRGTVPAMYLTNSPAAAGSAIQISGHSVFQSKANTVAVARNVTATGSYITLTGRSLFNPTTESGPNLYFENTSLFTATTSSYF